MKRLIFIIAMSFSIYAHAQEVCNDGIDNDNDGFVDCYDSKCYTNSICKDFFIGKSASCEVIPTTFPPFKMKLKYSFNGRTNHANRLIVGDVDNDGKPEIVSGYRVADNNGDNTTTSEINIFESPTSGGTLNLNKSIDIFADGFRATFEDIAMADLDKDGCAEIFILTTTSNGSGFRIMGYDCNGTKIWSAPIDFGTMAGYGFSVSSDPGIMGLVDFDGDGFVELYVRAQIFDAHTGKFMGEYNIDTQDNTGVNLNVDQGWGMTTNAPVAVDIISASPGLELVAGCRIYGVSINRGAMTATLTPLSSRPEYATRTGRGTGNATSVADFNQDGYLDVLAIGSKDKYNDNTTVFFWDVKNNNLKTYIDKSGISAKGSTTNYKNGWNRGAGRINVADIDGDTLMNAVYVSGRYLYALKEVATGTGLDTLWRETVTEETSGYTGCTMFDFNADGKSEIVYRDEENLYIYTTENVSGVVTVTASIGQTCKSRTSNEYPVVADIDADGHAEICVTCADGGASTGGAHDIFDAAKICVFESGTAVPWVAARRVWNQHGYFIVNVNDDLTIPTHQQLSEKVFADNAPCKLNGKSRPFNSFLNQAPVMNVFGCPQFAAPNLVPVATSLVVNRPICPDKDFTISLNITNLGNLAISGSVPVSFYNKNPQRPGATKYNTVFVTLTNLGPNDVTSSGALTVKGSGSPDSLYIVINDAGTTVPTSPIKLPNTTFLECDYANILPAYVVPRPAALTAIPTPNAQCAAVSASNGSARAFVPLGGGVEDDVSYNFYWTRNAVSKPVPADYVGSNFSGLPNGTYSVFAIHKAQNCSSDTVTTVVSLIAKTITPQIQLVKAYSNCLIPDGQLKVVVNGGVEPVTNFDYEWYEGNVAFTGAILSVNDIADKLGPPTYTVVVTDKASGCQGLASFDMPDIPMPVITATPTNITCSNSNNSGIVTASVVSGGVLSDFDFFWYNGAATKPTADFSPGSVYSGRTKGFYTVVATNKTSQCSSSPVTAEVTQTPVPVLTAPTVTSQTSCDATSPNGTATIGVSGGLATDYTFEWFESPITTGVPAKTGASVTGLKSITYTVKVTENVTGCATTSTVTIPNGVVTPTIVTTVLTANTSCNVNNGGIQVTSLSLGVPGDYDFQWYIGSSVKATSDFPSNTANTLSGLTSGTYTVLATHRIRKCITPSRTVAVVDNIPQITITNTNNPPNNCTNANGYILVNTTSSNTTGYNFLWYAGGVAVGTPLAFDPANGDINTGTSSKQDSLSTGTYTVRITNRDNGCKQDFAIFLPFLNGQKLNLVKTDITKCIGSGGAVDIKIKPTTGFAPSNYDVFIFEDITTDPLNSTGGALVPYSGTTIFPDTLLYSLSGTLVPKYYTVVAIVNATAPSLTNCRAWGSFEIKRVTKDPDLNGITVPASINANTFCNTTVVGNPGNGSIIVSVDDVLVVAPTPDEDFTWTPAAANTASLSGLKPGDYKVRVTYKKALNFGCFSERTFTILDKPTQLKVDVSSLGDLTPTDVTQCDVTGYVPSNSGSAVFNSIQVVGGATVTSNFAGYSFVWQRSDQSVIPDDGIGQLWDMNNLPVGSYFATATDNATAMNCAVTASFTIQDKTVAPVVNLISFVKPTLCFNPNKLGQLTTLGSGSNSSNYTYSWSSVPALTVAQIGGSSGEIAQNLNIGSYKIEVTNPANLCKVNDTYILPVDRANISLAASSIPITFCVVNPNFENGAVHASVISVQTANDKVTAKSDLFLSTYYTYSWSNAPVPNFQAPDATNLPVGLYTVKAVDKLDPTCQSESITVEIKDLSIKPVVTAVPESPVTNCDPTNPNGVASASVAGDDIHYSFDWYEGSSASAPIFSSGSQVSNLKPNTTYLVQAKNIVTGCPGTTTTQIEYKPSNGTPPIIELLSDVTSCDLNNPNGSLTASVAGNIINYTFTWTKVSDASFAPRVMPTIEGLDVGTYKVVALEISTKCPSEATADIGIHQIIPEFGLTLVDANCGKADGSAGIYITNTETITVETVEWKYEDGSIFTGNVITNAEAGKYTVTVITDQGCPAEKDFELKPQIHPYNGISRNSDGLNEYFHINCIDVFPNNMVRIYNRAGTLVYEASNYNNSEVIFDGKSNRGVSIMGTNLPDGTYFYIIDKRDGSKQLAGYLEIVN